MITMSIKTHIKRLIQKLQYFLLLPLIVQQEVVHAAQSDIQNQINNAAGQGISDVLTRVNQQTSGIPDFLMWIAFIIGVCLGLFGVTRMYRSSRDGERDPDGMKTGVLFIVFGALLTALGVVIGLVRGSLIGGLGGV